MTLAAPTAGHRDRGPVVRTRAADLLHDAAGMNAVARDTVLERCWRDLHTMTQHIILSPARYEIAGRVLLGLDPASPVI